jgi:hypothetical protein
MKKCKAVAGTLPAAGTIHTFWLTFARGVIYTAREFQEAESS